MGIFDHTIGQDLAVSILRRALAGDAQHAYLFTGPIGVGKGDMALEFAAGLICTRGGCGECEACDRVRQGIHPDVEVVRPEGPLAHYLQQSLGTGEAEAQAFARAAQGNLRYATLLASDETVRERRKTQVDWARRIQQGSMLDIELMLDEIMESLDALVDGGGAEIEVEAKERLEWEGDAALKRRLEKMYEERARRERHRRMSEGVEGVTSTMVSWYRDLAVLALGVQDTVFNYDYLSELEGEAVPGRVSGYLGAVDAARVARDRFRYNVDIRSTFQDMIFSMREALL